MSGNAVYGSFDQGQVPRIACFNRAKTPLGVSFPGLIAALQRFATKCVAPVWGTPARLAVTKGFVKGHWALIFLDNADDAGALAYHELTPDGMPVAKVFVETILKANEQISVAASHELAELLVDPGNNMWVSGPVHGTLYSYEAADPVEDLSFKFGGFEMSNFVYPAYFEAFRKARSTKFDHMAKVRRPFQVLTGGYQVVWENGKKTEIHATKAKKKRLAKEDRRQHRSDFRLLEISLGKPMRRSAGAVSSSLSSRRPADRSKTRPGRRIR